MTSKSRSQSPENDIFSLSIVPERTQKAAGTTRIDFNGLLQLPLLLHEDLKEGCGGQLWPAGMALSKYMLTYHRDLTNKSIIEIGAGGGLVGLAVAKGCSLDADMKLLITDQLPMLALMQKNISLNDLEDRVHAAIYDWGERVPQHVLSNFSESKPPKHPNLVLAADCVYFEPAFPLLLHTLGDLIGPRTICYFCFKKRRKADMRFIRDMMKQFTVEEVDYDERENNRREGVWLYKVTMR